MRVVSREVDTGSVWLHITCIHFYNYEIILIKCMKLYTMCFSGCVYHEILYGFKCFLSLYVCIHGGFKDGSMDTPTLLLKRCSLITQNLQCCWSHWLAPSGRTSVIMLDYNRLCVYFKFIPPPISWIWLEETGEKKNDYCFKLLAIAAKLPQSCPTLCDPIDGSPSGSPVPGILQARTLEWVAISFSNARKWKAKVKSFSPVRPLVTPWTAAHQAPPSMGFSRQEY